ncbi:MAG: 2-hydroxychromene-2-carboxylate isomerase [Deltaproteobacteria bacterium]|nr:2-hydroxychromene-2-carboxylate isomerase [Deltaproteobacteria bacterium]
MSEPMVEFFYDLSSPYAYLAHEEIGRVAAVGGAGVVWRPLLLGGLFKNFGIDKAPILGSSPNKQRILLDDMYRWAALRDLPFAWPAQFPLNAVRPLRVLCQLQGAQHVAVASDLFRRYWGAGEAIAEPTVLGEVLSAHGLDAAALLAGTDNPAVKQKLIDNTAEAFARGACGAPTFFVRGHLVWGNDRLDVVARLLDGWEPPRSP